MGMPGTVSVAAAILASAVLAGCAGKVEVGIAPMPGPLSSTTAAAPGHLYTLDDYLRDNGIKYTAIKPGTPGAPQVSLPVAPGWTNVDADAPPEAYWAIALGDPRARNAPFILARLIKLDGPADQAKIFDFAPNTPRTTPGYQGPDAGTVTKFGGFDAVEIAGTGEQYGERVFVANTTVVIHGTDGLYLLQMESEGPVAKQDAWMQAMAVIDEQTKITV